ncbi:MAG: hypothetical protein LBL43_00755, partial [Treponema sp.]|nr:hypothetical protein [Treponema sp.]
MLSVAVRTLGCKLNQLESESIAGSFQHEGFRVLPPGDYNADIIVINTCTVTSKAEQKARRMIRGALREYPGSYVIVTGCYAQLEGEAIAALEAEEAAHSLPCDKSPPPGRRLFVVSGDVKSVLLDLPRVLGEAGELPVSLETWTAGMEKAGAGQAGSGKAGVEQAGA